MVRVQQNSRSNENAIERERDKDRPQRRWTTQVSEFDECFERKRQKSTSCVNYRGCRRVRWSGRTKRQFRTMVVTLWGPHFRAPIFFPVESTVESIWKVTFDSMLLFFWPPWEPLSDESAIREYIYIYIYTHTYITIIKACCTCRPGGGAEWAPRGILR